MKKGLQAMLFGLSLLAAAGAYGQESQNISNRYGPPNYTGGTVPSPDQFYASYQPLYRQSAPTVISTIYPNPAQANANVVLGENAVGPVYVDVVNMNGTVLQSYTFSGGGNHLSFDVSPLPNGLYSIQVQERGKSMQSIKLLKQE